MSLTDVKWSGALGAIFASFDHLILEFLVEKGGTNPQKKKKKKKKWNRTGTSQNLLDMVVGKLGP